MLLYCRNVTHGICFISGGDEEGGETGFIGCMRNIELGSERIDDLPPGANRGVINGSCSVQDRCDPNPCEHGGICSQDYTTFSCNCDGTGYEGAVCHKSKYLVSCEEARMLNPTLAERQITVDIDDSGPLEPFPVNCIFQSKCILYMIRYFHSFSLRQRSTRYCICSEPLFHLLSFTQMTLRQQSWK